MQENLSKSKTTLVVVIPTKNRRALLERALESVRMQKYEQYRIVIVNDGSTDDTKEYLDSLKDPRIQVSTNEKSRGVNAARNAAFKTMREGEWAVQLDDDDLLLPDALQTIAAAIPDAPSHIQILYFNTITRTLDGDRPTGRKFEVGQTYYDPSYDELMIDAKLDGDNRPVCKWTLFPKYLFSEDINGFEGTWIRLLGRDGIGMRYLPGTTTLIDQAHGEEQLSMVAARRNPASFVRAYRHIFRDHAVFYKMYPNHALSSAISAIKLSIRAFDIPDILFFLFLYTKYFFQIIVRTKRPEEKEKG